MQVDRMVRVIFLCTRGFLIFGSQVAMTLGRPLGISDSAIDADLPMDVVSCAYAVARTKRSDSPICRIVFNLIGLPKYLEPPRV